MKQLNDVYTGKETWKMIEFDSLSDFYNYITTTSINKTFEERRKCLSSEKPNNKQNWSGTASFNDAVNLMKNGWNAGATTLTKAFKLSQVNTGVKQEVKNILSVCGYQAIVPLYLQGVPNNMISKKMTPVKKKVITINKITCVSSTVSSSILQEESVKCFQIIKKIEDSGIRVNLNLVISSGHVCVKIRLKSANERLNISKLAFPLVHPSMFRRLYFRFIEVFPTIPKGFLWGYGRVPSEAEFKKAIGDKEIVLPTIIEAATSSDIKTTSVDELIEKLK